MPVQAGSQTFLIQEMRNQSNAPTEHEESIENTHRQVILCLFRAKGPAVAHQVDEAYGDATVDIEDEVVFFRGCDSFDGDRVVEHTVLGEALLDEFFNELNAQIGVLAGFDSVANTGD